MKAIDKRQKRDVSKRKKKKDKPEMLYVSKREKTKES